MSANHIMHFFVYSLFFTFLLSPTHAVGLQLGALGKLLGGDLLNGGIELFLE